MSTPNVQTIAAQVTVNYGQFECRQCAVALRDAFKRNKIRGQILKLQARGSWKRGWIFMANANFPLPFSTTLGADYISENGMHYGVQVGGTVYDNIFRNGIALSDWQDQFTHMSGELICEGFEQF